MAKKNDINYNLLREIQPQGGISFADERYTKTGDGYETCLHIYEYPKYLDVHWLNQVINVNNSIASIDISTDNIIEVRKNINKSMSEQESRYNTEKEATAKKDAKDRYEELDRLYHEISQLGEIVKLVHIRIFLSARTFDEIDKEAKSTQEFLESIGFKSAIFLNEGKAEYLSMYQDYTTQSKSEYSRKGQELVSDSLAGGNPFNFSSLNDKHGTYLGMTKNTGGSVLFDMFDISNTRTSYNGLIVGKMGAGKSTTMKKLMLDMAIRGDYIRGFDPTGEFQKLINELGGKTISLDGTDGILNILEILKSSDESEEINLAMHLSKLTTIYKFLSPGADNSEVLTFEELLNEFYIDFGIISKTENKHYTGLPAKSYPVFSDLLSFIEKTIKKAKSSNTIQTELIIEKMKRLDKIRLAISSLVQNYGYMFDGHTSIDNVLDNQILFFNIKNLQNIKSEIFDVQIFSALTLCWDNSVKIGSRMKNLYDEKKIKWEDIQRTMIFIDESHRIVNANKIQAVQQLLSFVREGRKYFTGITFASQSIRDSFPDTASVEGIEEVRKLFELIQYKFIMNQDTSATNVINKTFKGTFTDSELNNIPKFEKGDCLLALSSSETVHFKIDISQEEKDLFAGGA